MQLGCDNDSFVGISNGGSNKWLCEAFIGALSLQDWSIAFQELLDVVSKFSKIYCIRGWILWHLENYNDINYRKSPHLTKNLIITTEQQPRMSSHSTDNVCSWCKYSFLHTSFEIKLTKFTPKSCWNYGDHKKARWLRITHQWSIPPPLPILKESISIIRMLSAQAAKRKLLSITRCWPDLIVRPINAWDLSNLLIMNDTDTLRADAD